MVIKKEELILNNTKTKFDNNKIYNIELKIFDKKEKKVILQSKKYII